MYDTIRIQLSPIYRFIDLPKGLERELEIGYHRHRIVSDFPNVGLSCPPYLEVEIISGTPAMFAKTSLEGLLMAYGMKERNDIRGRYYS
jgi:hypothetical protein